MSSKESLEGQQFDVLVIGGGINGVAIARECARAGRRTLLVEQHDFASGTTSRSTRIIHGGLRYLEQGDIAQVRESSRERQSLLRHYPHLVQPLEFLLALGAESRRSALAIRAGLWLYRRMGSALRATRPSQKAALEHLLDSGRQFSIFSFEDAQCEFPERLVAEWLVEAVAAGCVARNHTQVLELEKRSGRITGALLRDQLTGKEERVGASWTINAAGPWVDHVCQSSGVVTKHPMVGGVRGSHLVLPRFSGAPEAAVYTEAIDGRPIFVIPWNNQILLGTTEVPDNTDPAKVRPSSEETEYLLRSLMQLFPQCQVSSDDVHYSFAGVRPLPYSPKEEPLAISRRHDFHDHSDEGAAGMISVIGGKLTTAASLAWECAKKIGLSPPKSAPPLLVPEDEIDALLERSVAETATAGQISQQTARGIVEWYGPRASAIAGKARARPEFQATLCPHTSHIVAEAVYAYETECAATLGDVLLRRVPVALGACWSDECSRAAAQRVAIAMNWNEARTAAELQSFEQESQDFLQKPAPARA